MTDLLNITMVVICVVLALPVTLLLFQVLCSMWPRQVALLPIASRPGIAVLIPAHNESIGIAATLESVLPQLNPGDRCLVVADNCSDDTAQLALRAGAEVAERFHATKRGKGYALDFGVDFLERNPLAYKVPGQVIIVDADCIVAPGAIDRIAKVCASTGRPVQALYLMRAAAGEGQLMKGGQSAGAMMSIAEFAWRVKNWVRPLGFHRLGLPCQLMGSGMAFPWVTLRSMQLGNGHLVEDMKLGVDLAKAGKPPLFCPDALVLSQFPVSPEGVASQRTRWEHGHLGLVLGTAPGLLFKGLWMRRITLMALALDLCVPPLALLALLMMAIFCLTVGFAALTGSLLALVLSTVLLLMFALAVGLSWLRFGRDVISFGTLGFAVVYAVRKVPLYLKFMISRQMEWVRSKRDAD